VGDILAYHANGLKDACAQTTRILVREYRQQKQPGALLLSLVAASPRPQITQKLKALELLQVVVVGSEW